MARPRRYLAAGAYYHVGTSGNNRAPIIRDDWDRAVFFHILSRIQRRYEWRIHVSCLLGNHYHLVIETPLPNLSDGMRDLNGAYARAFNHRHNRRDHVFGRRFWSKVIESEEQYDATVHYVVHNPEHHGFVLRAEEWRWTSGPESQLDSPRVARHRQADPSALSRLLPHGRAAPAHRPRRQVQCGGVLGDVGRGLRPPLLLRPGGAPCPWHPAPVPAGRVHRRGAVHAPVGELLPRRAGARGRRAGRPPDRPLSARREVRLRGTAPARPPEPRARSPGVRRARDRNRNPRRSPRPGLLGRNAGTAREARGSDLETAHDQVPLLLDLAQPPDRANGQ